MNPFFCITNVCLWRCTYQLNFKCETWCILFCKFDFNRFGILGSFQWSDEAIGIEFQINFISLFINSIHVIFIEEVTL